MTGRDPLDEERRRIVRQVARITWGLRAAAVALAVLAGALIAWLFTGAGWPFLRTWAIISVLLLAVPAAVHLAPWGGQGGNGEGG